MKRPRILPAYWIVFSVNAEGGAVPMGFYRTRKMARLQATTAQRYARRHKWKECRCVVRKFVAGMRVA